MPCWVRPPSPSSHRMLKISTIGRNSRVPGSTAATSVVVRVFCLKGAITSKIKYAVKHKTSPARLAQLLQPSLAFCFSLQPMTAFIACFILLVIVVLLDRTMPVRWNKRRAVAAQTARSRCKCRYALFRNYRHTRASRLLESFRGSMAWNLAQRSSKVIDFGTNRKRVHIFLLG